MKNCPKCKTKMHGVSGVGLQSSMERTAEQSGAIEGYSCYNCGEWIDDVTVHVPVVPETPPELARPTGKRHREKVTTMYGRYIKKNLSKIRKMRETGMFWQDIAEKIAADGFKMNYTTLIRYYNSLQSQQAA